MTSAAKADSCATIWGWCRDDPYRGLTATPVARVGAMSLLAGPWLSLVNYGLIFEQWKNRWLVERLSP